MTLLTAAAFALAGAHEAPAHEAGGHAGFVATVSYIEPPQLGLLVRVTGGHEALAVRNLTRDIVEIFGEDGQPVVRLAPGRSGSFADPRIGSAGPPPTQGEFVKDWRIPGVAGGKRFEIVGFLGFRAPPDEAQAEPWAPAWAIALLGGVLVVALLALPLLTQRKGEKEIESSEPTGSE